MERETKKLQLPGGKEIEIKTYLTARERNDIRNIFMEEMKVSMGGQVESTITGNAMIRAERKLIETIIVSLDGVADNAVDRLLNGMPEDYDFVVAEANKLQEGNFKKEK